MQTWINKFFHHPREIGSVTPSSKFLARLMVSRIPPDAKVLELGPGSGVFTNYILKHLKKSSNLTCIEWEQELAAICKKKFPSVNVINADAEDILSNDQTQYDCIISGIPFAGMSAKKRLRTFCLIKDRLKPGGSFTMFQYSLVSYKELKNIFDNISLNFTLWNIPPAFVFTVIKDKKF